MAHSISSTRFSINPIHNNHRTTRHPLRQPPRRIPVITRFSPSKLHLSSFKQLHVTASAISNSQEIESAVDSERLIDELDKVRVYDLNGNGVPITDLWKDRKAVVAFARHFGCVFCRKRADFLATKKEEMDAGGVALVVIGPGSTDQAKAFYEQTKFGGGWIEDHPIIHGRLQTRLGAFVSEGHHVQRWLATGWDHCSWPGQSQLFIHSQG